MDWSTAEPRLAKLVRRLEGGLKLQSLQGSPGAPTCSGVLSVPLRKDPLRRRYAFIRRVSLMSLFSLM